MLDIMRIVRAMGYSYRGFRAAFTGEPAFRLEVVLALILTPIAVWLGGDGVERALLLGTLLLVLLTELLNSAVEAAIDRMGDEFHELSGRAKDMGSAAVFVAIALAVAVWGLVLLG